MTPSKSMSPTITFANSFAHSAIRVASSRRIEAFAERRNL